MCTFDRESNREPERTRLIGPETVRQDEKMQEVAAYRLPKHVGHLSCPVRVVCPACHGPLTPQEDQMVCSHCVQRFSFCGDFPDLIIGGRFDDPTGEAQLLYEEQSNADLTRNYLIPLFRKLWPSRQPAPRILSIGCGTGMDVDLLCEEGYECVGVDCGNRVSVWPRRRHPAHLLLANGKHLPFENEVFDGVFCGCVFPHVGVVGDTFQVTLNYHEDRLGLSREMSRVLKPQGKILVSSPNRWFPFDIFHGRPHGGFRPRPYWPGDPFLLSVSDYRKLFRQAGCTKATPQAVQGYWGFVRSKHSLVGRLLGLPVRVLFWLLSREILRALRGSFLSPWIVVLVEKNAGTVGSGNMPGTSRNV